MDLRSIRKRGDQVTIKDQHLSILRITPHLEHKQAYLHACMHPQKHLLRYNPRMYRKFGLEYKRSIQTVFMFNIHSRLSTLDERGAVSIFGVGELGFGS